VSLPSIERSSNLRPAVADAVLTKASVTIPVPAVNPSVQPSPPLVPTPSVINHVNPALAKGTQAPPFEGEPTYTSVPDPVKNSPVARQAPHDWTIKRPAPEKVEEPPKKPMSQVLMENIKSIWAASASAVQVHQIGNQIAKPPTPEPSQVPGELAKQVLTYQPTKIPKNEKL
jgi:hypothetical protein